MVGEDRKLERPPTFDERGVEGANRFSILLDLWLQHLVAPNVVVLQSVERGRIDKRAVNGPLAEKLASDAKVLVLRKPPVGDVVFEPLPTPDIREVLDGGEPAGNEKVRLLAVIKLRKPLDRNPVELEVASKAVEFLHEAREDIPHPAAPPKRARPQERREKAHLPERALLRRPVVERKVSVLVGTLPRKYSRYRRAAVAKLHLDLAPVRQKVF